MGKGVVVNFLLRSYDMKLHIEKHCAGNGGAGDQVIEEIHILV